ncbi:TPA: hypothetical protein N0F65_005835 [Lagenidium giganteum]|uniref:Amino acid transporter transmembrane domain-containing protein n=1 Tax=Lagenidium giganteum TaxID=4803 RepID=A0AAV2YFF5_9STRA|nr:TPA: hypothetical protein N0F65_005835 [Lagenidium giganteum]
MDPSPELTRSTVSVSRSRNGMRRGWGVGILPAGALISRKLLATTATMVAKKWMPTKEDLKAAFNLFCGVCGIGTLGMPANFARAGPVLGCLAIVCMGLANIYGAVVCSRTMLMAPRSVETFGDIGEWVMGKAGRYLVLIAQMAVCTMTPCAFLVLGGDLLDALFPGAFSRTFWIILMALMVLPICLTPTLKEGAGAAFAGCMGTVLADAIGVGMLIYGMRGHPAVPTSDIKFEQAATAFGNLALAYGAATLIPDIQRQHRDPARMPTVVFVTMTFITLMFVLLAAAGYSAVGCQVSGNLLYSIFPKKDTSFTKRGMLANFGPAVLAYLFMQLHISIAFAVFLHPMFYIAERLFLSMHQHQIAEEELPYQQVETPLEQLKRTSSAAHVSTTQDNDEDEAELAEYRGKGVALKWVTMRIALVVILVIAAVALQHNFVDLSDFVGASANAMSCIVMPITLYVKAMGKKMPVYERIIAVLVAVVCAGLSIYVSYTSGKKIIFPEKATENFPFCHEEHKHFLYYNELISNATRKHWYFTNETWMLKRWYTRTHHPAMASHMAWRDVKGKPVPHHLKAAKTPPPASPPALSASVSIMAGNKWVTKDDAMAAFNIFCCVCGIGTLGMPANFARSGPLIGVCAMLFMGFANIYAAVAVSKAMLIAPRSVRTFGDLGEWCMGTGGRYLVLISQMAVCLMTPCAFLVLGGNILNHLFPNAFDITFWIILMALMVLPICLTPTLKEGAGAAAAGCLGTIVADIVGIGMLFHGMSGHPTIPKPELEFQQVITSFGNLALAYGAATVIPDLQRQHGEPQRMPKVVFITVTFITGMFIVLAATGYSVVGCQISGNLLDAIFPEHNTNRTKAGMLANVGPAVIAYLGMQLHISIAFAVFLHPMFYIAERLVLGMHKHSISIEEDLENVRYQSATTPNDLAKRASSIVRVSAVEVVSEEDEAAEYKGSVMKYVTLRIVLVVCLVIVSVVLQDSFVDFADLIGASANTVCCIIVPIVLYVKAMGKKMPVYERVVAIVVIIVCGILGAYVTYTTGKAIIFPEKGPLFPFCAAEFETAIYYNVTSST